MRGGGAIQWRWVMRVNDLAAYGAGAERRAAGAHRQRAGNQCKFLDDSRLIRDSRYIVNKKSVADPLHLITGRPAGTMPDEVQQPGEPLPSSSGDRGRSIARPSATWWRILEDRITGARGATMRPIRRPQAIA